MQRRIEAAQENVNAYLTKLGFSNSQQIINELLTEKALKDNPSSKKTDSEIAENKKIVGEMMLRLMDSNIHRIESSPENSKKMQEMIAAMQIKSGDYATDAVAKLILYCNSTERIDSLYHSFNYLKENIANQCKAAGKDISGTDVDKIAGYMLTLNLNKNGYDDLMFKSLQDISLAFKVNSSAVEKFIEFIEIDKQAKESPDASRNRADLLHAVQLTESHLQRDPEEARKYDAQMASSQGDKNKLLVGFDSGPIVVVDIGPAGGATFTSVMDQRNSQASYFGIELEANELRALNKLQQEYLKDHAGEPDIPFAKFVQGNALDLEAALTQVRAQYPDETKDKPIGIVMSSVMHEIYSYCPYKPDASQSFSAEERQLFRKIEEDMAYVPSATVHDTAANPDVQRDRDQGRYNIETIYKVYVEAMKALSQNPQGGVLSFRDGVTYEKPNEPVAFKLQDEGWVDLFKAFLKDHKYAHLQKQFGDINVGDELKLEAKYVQEFLFKAGWGAESFATEINEVYTYLTLENHQRLLEAAAKRVGAELTFNADAMGTYTQDGYKTHTTDAGKIEIVDGFGPGGFPPTNMVIKVGVRPALELREEAQATAEAAPTKERLSVASSATMFQPAEPPHQPMPGAAVAAGKPRGLTAEEEKQKASSSAPSLTNSRDSSGND